MTELDEYVSISAIAEELASLTEEQIHALWMKLQDADATTQTIFKSAVYADRLRRSLFVSSAKEAA